MSAIKTLWKIARKAPFRDYMSLNKVQLIYKISPYTMVGYPRLSNAYELVKALDRLKIEGSIVECGVWKGGCSALMAKAAENRHIWLFDSFEGLPAPTEADGEKAASYASKLNNGVLKSIGKCVGPLSQVKEIFFDKLRINPNRVHIIQGWFQDTLSKAKSDVGPIALLRLDGDWYESTKICLEHLYDLVVPGGFIIIDDYYCWEGCLRAVDEFLAQRSLRVKIYKIDEAGAYFSKG